MKREERKRGWRLRLELGIWGEEEGEGRGS